MNNLQALTKKVGHPRRQFIEVTSGLSHEQSQFKPDSEAWSIVDNVEHMFCAELGGFNGIKPSRFSIKLIQSL